MGTANNVVLILSLFLSNMAGQSAQSATASAQQEVGAGISTNVSTISSGSVTYSIRSIRPKENLLGSRNLSPSGNNVSFVTAEHDVVLTGLGWIKWQGNCLIAGVRRFDLSFLRSGTLQIEIHDYLEAMKNTEHKLIMKEMQSEKNSLDDLAEQSSLSAQGPQISQRCFLGGNPVFHLTVYFREIGLFSPVLADSLGSYWRSDKLTGVSNDDGRILSLTNRMGWIFSFSREYSCMPVSLSIGNKESKGRFNYVNYRRYEGVWFPESFHEETWADGKLRYSINLTVQSVELNKTYPLTDFDVVFPEGTEIEALRNDEEPIVK